MTGTATQYDWFTPIRTLEEGEEVSVVKKTGNLGARRETRKELHLKWLGHAPLAQPPSLPRHHPRCRHYATHYGLILRCRS